MFHFENSVNIYDLQKKVRDDVSKFTYVNDIYSWLIQEYNLSACSQMIAFARLFARLSFCKKKIELMF